ncbi:Ubiquitin-conjugating enzyme E2 protein [Raphanus sativus]|nr:Ubiquitin-conjugating enzyme E2 protein [Raphanus sativus]
MAKNQASLLLQKQLKDLCKHPVDGFSVGLVDENNIFQWSVSIIGPPDTLKLKAKDSNQGAHGEEEAHVVTRRSAGPGQREAVADSSISGEDLGNQLVTIKRDLRLFKEKASQERGLFDPDPIQLIFHST